MPGDPRRGPKGKLPAIVDGGVTLGDSEIIRWHLELKHGADFDTEQWELFRIDQDPSECHDLASAMPEKLRELIDLWWDEAHRHGVPPLDDRGVELFGVRFRDRSPHPANRRYVYRPPMSPMPAQAGASIGGRSFDLTATVTRATGDEGVLYATGTENSGVSFFVQGDRLVFDYNAFDAHTIVESDIAVPVGRSDLTVRVRRTGGRIGTASIEKSEVLAEYLMKNGYKQIDFTDAKALEKLYAAARAGKPAKLFAVLNARFHEQEAYIVAEAGVPGAVTIAGHGYSNGDEIFISGVGGMTRLNGVTWLVANATTNTFTLLRRLDGVAVLDPLVAQLGSRLIDATAKTLAAEFFQRFSAELGPAPAASASGGGAAAAYDHDHIPVSSCHSQRPAGPLSAVGS